jgi:hypothetical protein
MGMGATTDHTLEKLAANVRAATTTSASDRAKQIFVQAWCVFRVSLPLDPPTIVRFFNRASHSRCFLSCRRQAYFELCPLP